MIEFYAFIVCRKDLNALSKGFLEYSFGILAISLDSLEAVSQREAVNQSVGNGDVQGKMVVSVCFDPISVPTDSWHA